ncbi:hypothetical protein [Sulfurisphaera ohwakuensis]|uniref:Uncharacterized protein n=1 Tax=Sulfurisphaera ohwakuensis TaxID=69656 RepID=A0A650CKH1_SULOH|nr:hypothetical protein [Sulfurisphaera ohwakuensis]MBB5253691.1 hypothetical protein [Sulfurisphaera ohwakuensis]QGR18326.1 hypothetical protein D1869_14855 [Sulfurisphaera ohwakuensis]
MAKIGKLCGCSTLIALGAFLFGGGLAGLVRIASPEFPLYLGVLLMLIGTLSASITIAPDKSQEY